MSNSNRNDTTKTFYSVRHYYFGKDRPFDEWFDNKEEARRFSEKDLSEKVVIHRFQNDRSIRAAEYCVRASHMNELGEDIGPLA